MKNLVTHRRKRNFMNCVINFTAHSYLYKDEIDVFFDKGFEEFQKVVKKFSRFNNNSELSVLNRNQEIDYKVSDEMFYLVQFALKLAKRTKGAFDPTIIDLLEAYGYSKSFEFFKLKNESLVKKEIENIMKNRPSYKDIILNDKNKTIKLNKNQRLDLGGVGKGYAIDKAFEILKPLENFSINAGGDIRVFGKDKDNFWETGLYNPDDTQSMLGYVKLESGDAIACSGAFARKSEYFHHLIDTSTGLPKKGVKIVFVKASTALLADSWATIGYVMGKDVESIAPKELKVKIIL